MMKMIWKLNRRDRKDALFFASMLIIPTIQFIIFYVGVKFEIISLSFQTYDPKTNEFIWDFGANFQRFFQEFSRVEDFKVAIENSLIASVFTIGVGISLGLVFSLYIYHKQFLNSFYRVVLFMPSIISAMVIGLVFAMFVDTAYPDLMYSITGEKVKGLFANPDTQWGTLIFYALWIGFGSPILMYVGAMSGISESLSEAARLDGCNLVQESWYITLPLIYPTILVYVTTGVATIFTNQLHLFTFFLSDAHYSISTMGYWFYVQSKAATSESQLYPYVSAVGLIFTFVAIPMTYFVRWFMKKVGPKTE